MLVDGVDDEARVRQQHREKSQHYQYQSQTRQDVRRFESQGHLIITDEEEETDENKNRNALLKRLAAMNKD